MDSNLYTYLLMKVKEPQLVQRIATMTLPSFPIHLKQDIQSFIFTWFILNYIYVPWAIEVATEALVDLNFPEEKIKWNIYNDILKTIHHLIMRYNINRNPYGKNFILKKKDYRDMTNFIHEDQFNIWWCHRILSSSWDHSSPYGGIGCTMIRESLNENEMLKLIQKFLLRFLPLQRLTFLKQIGIYDVFRELTS